MRQGRKVSIRKDNNYAHRGGYGVDVGIYDPKGKKVSLGEHEAFGYMAKKSLVNAGDTGIYKYKGHGGENIKGNEHLHMGTLGFGASEKAKGMERAVNYGYLIESGTYKPKSKKKGKTTKKGPENWQTADPETF